MIQPNVVLIKDAIEVTSISPIHTNPLNSFFINTDFLSFYTHEKEDGHMRPLIAVVLLQNGSLKRIPLTSSWIIKSAFYSFSLLFFATSWLAISMQSSRKYTCSVDNCRISCAYSLVVWHRLRFNLLPLDCKVLCHAGEGEVRPCLCLATALL